MKSKLLILSLLIVLFIGCPKNEESFTPIDQPSLPQRGFYMGTLPTPFQNETFDSVYKKVSEYCEFVPVWGRPTPFYELANDLKGSWGRTFVTQLIRNNGMFPIINLSFIGPGMRLISPPEIENPSLSNPEWRQAYKRASLEIVKAIRPLYLSLGNEVNRWYEFYDTISTNPNSFLNFISLYNEIYDTLKLLSPELKIFVTFAREITSEFREANLNVLRMFDSNKLDLLAFTSYPYAVASINRPEDLPINYYSHIETIIPGKPLSFTEIGWPSLPAFGGESAQAGFIELVAHELTRNQGLSLHLLGWPWLTDLDSNDYMGLIKRNGTPKLGYAVWKNLARYGK
jgi:hypothetical protein